MTVITDEYRSSQVELHARHPDYGSECLNYVKELLHWIEADGYDSLLDYGAGKGRLGAAMADAARKGDLRRTLSFEMYDPAVKELSVLPEPAELVVSIDVLEHVELECEAEVLKHIASLTERCVFLTIGLKPAAKILADGRNAHINLKSPEAWLATLHGYFRHRGSRVTSDERSLVFMGFPR
jgi:2-polyprenyl-3-methyl-5-hydroxy-6-metoxy-1,4-benzoquinol methylase